MKMRSGLTLTGAVSAWSVVILAVIAALFLADLADSAAAAAPATVFAPCGNDESIDVYESRIQTTTEIVLKAEVVLYGRINELFYDRERYGVQGYTAEMEVYCSLKGVGSSANRFVNISHGG